MLIRIMCVVCLCAGILTAQEANRPADPKPMADSSAETALPSTATLPRDFPVLTLQLPCQKAAAKNQGLCKSVVTRAQFEQLVNAVNPKMVKKERRAFAENYSQVIALSQEALRRGLDKDPQVQALLLYARMNTLASALSKQMFREAMDTSPNAVERFYHQHPELFALYNFERIFVPRESQANQEQAADFENAFKQSPSAGPDMKEVANQVHERALKGEDFASLQERVFDVAGIQADPKVKFDDIGPGSVPAEQNEIFSLKTGQVSSLLAGSSGYYVYKLISKQLPPLEKVREQVEMRLQSDRANEAIKKIESFAEVKINDAYFDKYDPPAPGPNEPDVDTD